MRWPVQPNLAAGTGVRTKVCVLILIVCVILTIFEVRHFKTLWVEHNFTKSLSKIEDAKRFPTPPAGTDLARADPEAASMVNYLISERKFFREPDINRLAVLASIYPQNEFFLYDLCTQLSRNVDSINPAAALTIADRLISIDFDNAHYHYAKALVLLYLRSESDFHRALDELETGNKSPRLEFAYDKYRSCLDDALGKSYMSKSYMSTFSMIECILYRRLLDSFSMKTCSHPGLDNEYSERLRDIGCGIGQKLIEQADNEVKLLIGANIVTSMVRQKLTQQQPCPLEAKQLRYQLCRSMAIEQKIRKFGGRTFIGQLKALRLGAFLALALNLYVYLAGFWLLVFVVTAIRNEQRKFRTKFFDYILFLFSLLYYMVLVALLSRNQPGILCVTISSRLPDWTDNLHLFAIITPTVLWLAIWIMSLLPPYDRKKLHRHWAAKTIICATLWILSTLSTLWIAEEAITNVWQVFFFWSTVLPLLFIVLWLALLYGGFLLRSLPYRKLRNNRVVQLVLAATCIAGVNKILLDINWLSRLPLVLLVSSSAVIIAHNPAGKLPKLIDALKNFFSRTNQIAATRTRILHIVCPYIFVCWIALLIFVPLLTKTLSEVEAAFDNPMAVYHPLPSADESTYQKIVSKINLYASDPSSDKPDFSRSTVIRCLPMLMPHDLQPLLNRLGKSSRSIDDSELLRVLDRCDRDVRAILVDNLQHPESRDALLARAKSGDTSVKAVLEELFQQELDPDSKTWHARELKDYHLETFELSHPFEIPSALALISEPNEAAQRFLTTLKTLDSTALNRDARLSPASYLYSSLHALPRPQAAKLLKFYLTITDYSDITSGNNLTELADALSQFAGAELAEEILVRLGDAPLFEKPFDSGIGLQIVGLPDEWADQLEKPRDRAIDLRQAISSSFSNNSIPILKEALNTDNPDLRAYVVWQLTKLGYEWSDKKLKKILADTYWKVRLNSLFAVDMRGLCVLADDESPVVRVVAQLMLRTE